MRLTFRLAFHLAFHLAFYLAFHLALQHVREIRSYRDADDTQQSHRLDRFQHGRPLCSVYMSGQICLDGGAIFDGTNRSDLPRFLTYADFILILLSEVCNYNNYHVHHFCSCVLFLPEAVIGACRPVLLFSCDHALDFSDDLINVRTTTATC